MTPEQIEKWQKHRAATEQALHGRAHAFKETYGYVPKAIHRKRNRAYSDQ